MTLRVQAVHTLEEAAAMPSTDGLVAFDPRLLAAHRPDAHLVLLDDDRPMARCSLWWTSTPALPDRRAGVIGHYAAADAASAVRLLENACARLVEVGCNTAIGPMDGNTWHRYRFVTDRGEEPTFFLEPDNPDEYPGHFRDAGFATLARYYSAVSEDLSVVDPRLATLEQRAAESGITIRSIDMERFDSELHLLYRIVLATFRSNYLYTPISEDDFIAQYAPIRAYIRQELVLFAEREGQCVGFVFALPNLLQAQRGEAIDTAVVKTIGVLPGRQNSGLGGLLLARCHEACRALGFRRAIHALMYESNVSRMLSSRYARPFRRYELFSKDLRP